MNESSVSPLRCEVMTPQPAALAMLTALMLSVMVPIWFTWGEEGGRREEEGGEGGGGQEGGRGEAGVREGGVKAEGRGEVHLEQQRVARLLVDGLLHAGGVRHEEVISDDLAGRANLGSHRTVGGEVVLVGVRGRGAGRRGSRPDDTVRGEGEVLWAGKSSWCGVRGEGEGWGRRGSLLRCVVVTHCLLVATYPYCAPGRRGPQ